MRHNSKLMTLLLVIAVLVFLALPLSAMSSSWISLSYFEDYSAEGSVLSAARCETETLQGLYCASLTDMSLQVAAQGSRGEEFDIISAIRDGEFTRPVDNCGNYQVLSILNLGQSIRIVLKAFDESMMLYVDFPLQREVNIRDYNPYWYHSFVQGGLVLEEEIVLDNTREASSAVIKLYSATSYIYGGTIKEYIRIKALQEFPSTINNSTGGGFCFSLGIRDKWTVFTPENGGSSITTDGCSLGMNGGEINLSTPTGEVVSSLTTNFVGTMYSPSNHFSIGWNFNIPSTPFSLTYSYSFTDSGYGRTSFMGFPGGVTQVGHIWNSSGYWTFDPAEPNRDLGDGYYTMVWIDTKTDYQVFGTKNLNFSWDYHITGEGYNDEYGVAVTVPSRYDRITGTVPYTLIDCGYPSGGDDDE